MALTYNLESKVRRAAEALDGVDVDVVSEKVKTGFDTAQNRLRSYASDVATYSRNNPWPVVFGALGVAAAVAAIIYRDEIVAFAKPYFQKAADIDVDQFV